MALITIAQLRTKFPFEIHKDTQDDQLRLPLRSASRRLREWIGTERYAEAAAEIAGEESSSSSAELSEETEILQHAEGYLVMHYAMLGLNTQLRPFGIVRSEQVEQDTVNSYFSPADTANFTTQYLEMAREIAEPFALADGTPGSSYEVVRGKDC